MSHLDIKIYGEEVLRKISKPVTEITPELVSLAKDMLETMYEAGGCGLAAPQIGENIRLVVIDTTHPDEEDPNPYIMFNHEWEAEPDSQDVECEEGCLSIPEIWCKVKRPGKVFVRYTDENGERKEIHNCEGLFARCIQHEHDHLDGKLFIDFISTADRTLNQSKLRNMAKKKA
jgi:peptide deformylase